MPPCLEAQRPLIGVSLRSTAHPRARARSFIMQPSPLQQERQLWTTAGTRLPAASCHKDPDMVNSKSNRSTARGQAHEPIKTRFR